MESREMNKEEMEKRLHELSVEIVREAKSQYSKSKIKNLTIWPRVEGAEEDEEDIVYVNSELYNEYYGLLYDLEIALEDPEEGDGILIKYKPKKKEYGLEYWGSGYDFAGYHQVGGMYIDNVSEEEFERSEKEEKLKNLMDTDSKLDEELSKVKEEGKDR